MPALARGARRRLGFGVAALLFFGPADAGEFGPLLRFVPRDANALLLVDAEALKQTPLAKERKWFDRVAADRATFVPPEADRIIVASDLDAADGLRPRSEVALIGLAEAVDLEEVARTEGGYVDTLAGQKVAWAPSGAYLVPVSPQVLGQYSPADRQGAARWIASVVPPATPQGELTPYLKAAADAAGGKTPIVMAFDLADAFPPHAIEEAVMTANGIKVDAKRREKIADVLTSLRGATISLAIAAAAHGTVRFDFGVDTEPLRGIERELFRDLVDQIGADVPRREDWNVQSYGKSVTARGDLTTSGLRRLLSLVEVPTTKFSSLKGVQPAADSTQVMSEASRDYFRSVSTLLDDLRETLDDARENHALYMERYARKIDRLPILNVDDELLGWGATVAETLRGASLSTRQAGMRAGVQKSSAYGAYQYSYDGYGYYGGQPTENALAQVTVQAGAAARNARLTSWKGIEDSTVKVRQAMTKKYGVEF